MKPEDFYLYLAQRVTGPQQLTLAPGPLTIRVNVQDAWAARLLLWLAEHLPEDATIGDLHDVLDAARWWSTFWAALPRDDEPAQG